MKEQYNKNVSSFVQEKYKTQGEFIQRWWSWCLENKDNALNREWSSIGINSKDPRIGTDINEFDGWNQRKGPGLNF